MTHQVYCRQARRGFSLIEILVVVLLLALLAGSVYTFYVGKSGKKGEQSHGPIAEAQTTVCTSNLQQVRMAIDMQKQSDQDGKNPGSLDELKLPHEILICPDGKEPYVYDPETGQVHCVHPGHEKF